MFLDEELLKIGRETELTKEEMLKAISEMVKSCFNNLQKSTNEKMTDNNIVANFKRVNNTWNRVAEILEKENRGFLKKDGFKFLIENNPEFNGIFFK